MRLGVVVDGDVPREQRRVRIGAAEFGAQLVVQHVRHAEARAVPREFLRLFRELQRADDEGASSST